MTFTNPLGLLALLAVPVILAIHLYRRRFPKLAVAGAFLWGGETEVRDAGRTRDRLPITATLLLELLAATLLALILAGPRLGSASRVAHLIAVLDDSASMAATLPGGASPATAALTQIERRLDRLGRNAVVTVLTTGRRPAMLAGPAISWEDAKPALATWQPAATAHDFAPAWDLAEQLAGAEGSLLFLTDALPAADAALPARMETIALGRPVGNLALTAARWRLDEQTGRGTVSLRVGRFGPAGGAVTLTGTSGGNTVFSQAISVPAGGTVPVAFEVPGGLGELSLATTADPLAIDSRVTLVEPQRRGVKVAVTLPADHPAIGPLRRVLGELPAVQTVSAEQADLIIGPAVNLPAADPNLWWLGVGPLDVTDAARTAATNLAGPYVIDKRDALTDGVTLGGVVWGGAQEVPLAVSPLMSAGRFPLLARLEGTPANAYLLNIDLSRSNLADSPDWPILISNLIAAVRDDRPGLRRWNYRSGESIRLRLPVAAERGSDTLTLSGPELPAGSTATATVQTRPIARTRTVEITPPDAVGVYTLRDGDNPLARFAVNFQDDAESDLTDRRNGDLPAQATAQGRGITLATPYSWPILAAIACVLAAVVADWWVLRGRKR